MSPGHDAGGTPAVNRLACCKDVFVPTCGEATEGGSAFDSCGAGKTYDSTTGSATTVDVATCCKDAFVPTCGEVVEGGSAFDSCGAGKTYDSTTASVQGKCHGGAAAPQGAPGWLLEGPRH